MLTRRYLISGQVQGVGYRYFAQRAGRALKLTGWVRNLSDGRVEALAYVAKRILEDFEAKLRMGPLGADVRSVEVEHSEQDAKLEGFDIR